MSTRWVVLFLIAIAVAVLASATSEGAVAKSIHVCAWVEKPKPGQKCVTVNVLGYKGKLCK